ncbi:MAG: ileS [Candidatus Saccharibacteria bacterium]|nr:ileS [Candidatus Saccharibacteria bacterium]MDB5180328.1 ileS [Candidatus Saccharibacteria bacterium]
MKFQANSRRRAVEYEKDIVQYWKENKTFEKSIEQRPKDDSYVFYDGPPFITGVPHHGTLLSSVVKDAVPRYQTMKGKRVERVWGWDCHGLPAENFVEKKLGITDRHEIGTRISLAEYITTARESMVQTSDLWEHTIDRIGRWVDFKGAYKTMDKDYMESVWWAFKQLYEKGKIYEGERVLMYDTKWATPLSKAEVTMDAGAYVDVTDPSVYVKFKISTDDKKDHEEQGKSTYLLAWTTTPWTLPGNTALAINPDIKYVQVEYEGAYYVLAEALVEKVFTNEKHQPLEYRVVRPYSSSELLGRSYEPLFEDRGENAHKIWAADYVTTDAGTGIVHLAPAYGEEDFLLAKEKGIPVVHVLDEYGKYIEGEWEGLDVWENNKAIAKTLLEQGIVWKIEYIRHEYPHNPRTGHRLMYRAHPSWFMDIDGQRVEMLEQNTENINWFPDHIKHGRFEKTVETAPDWNLSRDRFWATAMPVWKGTDDEGVEHIKVIGSYEELKELSGVELEDYHRPWVDDVTFEIDGVTYTRIDKVLDCWFESGSMPFAQFHYPFENVEKFEANFPGDFIVEYVGQVRAWFYYVHAVNVGLFGHNAFKNVIVTGNVAGNDGRKMSKSLGNFTDPNELMDKFSADSLRFLLLSSPLLSGEDFALQDKEVGDIARKLSMVWNMYDFFTMYAEVDGWEFDGNLVDPSDDIENPLDQWIISRVHQLIHDIEEKMDGYDIAAATKPILPFLDDASNWYVRRSRRRFWKSEDDNDKNNAYRTLHYVLVRLSQALAPFVPFMAEELYRKLTGGESVHLTDWPEVGNANELVLSRMARTRELIEQGLSLRMYKDENQLQIKVRQPLSTLIYAGEKLEDFYATIIAEEVNVKAIENNPNAAVEVVIDKFITPELRREGLAREVIRYVQAARKNAGLNVDDRIVLSLVAEGDLAQAIEEHNDAIAAETLAAEMNAETYDHTETFEVEKMPLGISLKKA